MTDFVISITVITSNIALGFCFGYYIANIWKGKWNELNAQVKIVKMRLKPIEESQTRRFFENNRLHLNISELRLEIESLKSEIQHLRDTPANHTPQGAD